MKKTNTLTGHKGQHHTSRADKMSGHGKSWIHFLRGQSKKWMKKFYGKKRRVFLKDINNEV